MIVEQEMRGEFNRGKLLNIGFMQTIHMSEWHIFHDVDMLSQGGVPNYRFTEKPTLFATNASQFNWQIPFPEYFGGVTGMSREDFYNINGYPNNFWGWGGEDNCLYNSIRRAGLEIVQRPHRYYSLPHDRLNRLGIDLIKLEKSREERESTNGLVGLEYGILRRNRIQQGTHIVVEIS